MPRGQFATGEGALRFSALLLQVQAAHEPQSPDVAHSAPVVRLRREVRPVDEAQAGHELQWMDEARAARAPQAP
jgi:hypothetical protein